MKPIAGIVAPAVSIAEVTRRVHLAHVKVQDARRAAEADHKRATKSAEAERLANLECGRELVVARKQWPARGPNAKGWGDFLRDQGIPERSARDWMQLAGHVESQEFSEPDSVGSEIPTRRQVQAERRDTDDAASDDGPAERMPEDERAALVARLQREEDERRKAALTPLKMESRETASAKVLSATETCIATLNGMDADPADCTTSTTEHERIKARLLTLYRMVGHALARIGVETDSEPVAPSKKRQLTLVPGDL